MLVISAVISLEEDEHYPTEWLHRILLESPLQNMSFDCLENSHDEQQFWVKKQTNNKVNLVVA